VKEMAMTEIFPGKAPMRALFLMSLLILPSCAAVDYLPPRQGTSAELQSILARSLEENLKEVSFDPAGKTLDIQVRALGGHQTPQGLERYVKSLLQEWTVQKGGKVGPGDWRMNVFLPVLGATATRRDMTVQNIPLYYSEKFRGTGRLVVVVRDGEGKVAGVWRTGKGSDFADIFLMRILGPFDVPF
jgi:hypothetical protein